MVYAWSITMSLIVLIVALSFALLLAVSFDVVAFPLALAGTELAVGFGFALVFPRTASRIREKLDAQNKVPNAKHVDPESPFKKLAYIRRLTVISAIVAFASLISLVSAGTFFGTDITNESYIINFVSIGLFVWAVLLMERLLTMEIRWLYKRNRKSEAVSFTAPPEDEKKN